MKQSHEHLRTKRSAQNVPVLIVRDQVVQVVADKRGDVDADDVKETERGGFGPPEQGAGEAVHLFDCVVIGNGKLQQAAHDIAEHAVADEVGHVLCDHDALAQPLFGKLFHVGNDDRIRAGAGNQFQQAQVAGRIEEVGAQETSLEVIAAAGADDMDRDSGRVGADDGVIGSH